LFFSFVVYLTKAQALEVLFLEKRDANGKLIQLEEKGRFFHVAIKYGECWLHTDTYRGVVCDVQIPMKYGNPAVILHHDRYPWHEERVSELLGLPYDYDYMWGDNRIYCSELLARLLDLKPKPMKFNTPFWSARNKLPIGDLGLSPDGAYEALKQNGFEESFNCSSNLN
jgi:hypothetical protein